jgi:hypothetical protein
MAQTKRKRRTKHRGTAAGTIETRGRTGRPPTPEERKRQQKVTREQARQARVNRPPTWSGAAKRAGLASAFMFIFLIIFSKGKIVAAVLFAVLSLLIYVPAGYYLDLFMYRRRQAKGLIK